MRRLFKGLLLVIVVLILTLFTQTGGIVLLGCLPLFMLVSNRFGKSLKALLFKGLIFTLLYLVFSFVVLPPLARIVSNRTPLPLFEQANTPLKPRSLLFCLLNRHYVKPELKELLEQTSEELHSKYTGSKILYLDANFPLFDGFPLLPHLSHSDGKKIDLAFYYVNKQQEQVQSTPSPIGYGAYTVPEKGEKDQPRICKEAGYWFYNLLYIKSLQGWLNNIELDQERTKLLVNLLLSHKNVEKIFIEPHLADRMNLYRYNKVRFHGCRAVRHDDHIHLQIK